ncbi:hypothetical protein B0H10DRAFT_2137868 [Mycena sp. CBHHK59/15]|nr:hypothetical protein B0H10DRAFT_2137868 [Mycena sp. CBHHK59/15]
MVKLGGPALDDDEEEHVERPEKGKKKKGIPTAPLIVVKTVAPRAPTRKALRNGNAKWTLKDLPLGTSEEFTNEVVPLARELVGTLPPWVGLTVKQVQGIVDRVYGEGVHEVTPESAWFGLLGYRLSDWRSGIGSQAVKAIETLIESYAPGDSDDESEETDAILPVGSSAVPAADSAANSTPAAEPDTGANGSPMVFSFKTPAGIAAFVQWALQPHADSESGTMAFHWKIWGNGTDKKGFLQGELIVYTFAYHLSSLEAIPGAYGRSDAPPTGALLLSMQAVQRALQFWRTGEYINPNKPSNHFSIDNWGDTAVTVGTQDKKFKGKLLRRATKFLP